PQRAAPLRAARLRSRRNERLRPSRRPRAEPRNPHAQGSRMSVTAKQVWAALAEIPDPEIPVVSLVDLGVVKDVRVDGERVRVEFTPTFLGCPALEAMRDAMAEKVRDLGGEPQVDVLLDDS